MSNPTPSHATARAIIDRLEGCTGMDDHDSPVCFKCEALVNAIAAALEAQREADAKVVEDYYAEHRRCTDMATHNFCEDFSCFDLEAIAQAIRRHDDE